MLYVACLSRLKVLFIAFVQVGPNVLLAHPFVWDVIVEETGTSTVQESHYPRGNHQASHF